MGGQHRSGPGASSTPVARRLAWLVVAPVAVVVAVAMALLWPTGDGPERTGGAAQEVRGEVVSLDRQPCEQSLPDDVNGCGTATVRLDAGEGTGDGTNTVVVPLPNGAGAPEVGEGDDVVLVGAEGPDGLTYDIVDQQRGLGLWLLAGVFAVALAVVGGWRGLTALAGLAVTVSLLVWFVVPAVLAGEPPLLVALVGATVIMLVVLYLTHGPAVSTTVAVLGTLASFTLTGVLAAVTVPLLHLTGITDDLSMAVQTTYGVDTRGLLVAGIVIGALGVLDDVTVTQAVSVEELARANPDYTWRQLYAAGGRVGRAHIASVVNTIVLAYAGSSLPLLVLTLAESGSLADVATDQFIAQEVVRSLVATLGIIAAVPLTTALAAVVARRVG